MKMLIVSLNEFVRVERVGLGKTIQVTCIVVPMVLWEIICNF